MSRTH